MPQKKVALAFTSKDRINFTAQTLPRILDEAKGNFDLFWLDGSATPEGKQFPSDFAFKWRNEHDGEYPLHKFFGGVGGGPAAAIQTAWKYLYDQGYDYIGLIENDVLLSPGWFTKTMALFEKKVICGGEFKGDMLPIVATELHIGAVSARCFTDRILDRHDGYALMANVGAGMHICKSELIPKLLMNWEKPALWEMEVFFKHFIGRDYPMPKMVREGGGRQPGKEWFFSHDWYWEAILLRDGYATLACTPSLAVNLDDPDGIRDPVER